MFMFVFIIFKPNQIISGIKNGGNIYNFKLMFGMDFCDL